MKRRTEMSKILQALIDAEGDQSTYVDILYRRGPRMAQSYEAAKARLESTRAAIEKLKALEA